MTRVHSAFLYRALFLIFALLDLTAQVQAADAPPALTARETGVALYARQDAQTDRIATFDKGETLFPMAEAIGGEIWYMVRTKQGLVGWVRGADVVVTTETKEAFREKESGTSTWAARSADGRTFSGTWSLTPKSNQRSAGGGWTLSDARGATVMRGSWSADKHDTGWNGVWHAVVEGRPGEHSGSWSAEFPHVRNAIFSDLFGAAVKEAMRGLWTGGNASGSWSIRYVKPQ